ncbi:MAG TPA: VOC family protein [Ferrovibrio sp.]|uniref:VOC family protein n=1 Tax=Ferrovibrio sp. TaxID=1917215 RepID=UPI002ED21127
MAIVLNHMIVPSHDRERAAQFFARIFGLSVGERGYFTPVKVNGQLTLLFDNHAAFDVHHYAFHVEEAEFDAIFRRIKQEGIAYGSSPGAPENGRLNDWGGGRGVYFRDPDGHLLELMTVAQ